MSDVGTRFNGFIKTFFLIIIFFLLSSTLLQIKVPSLNMIQNRMMSSIVKRQLQLQPATDDLVNQGWVYYDLGQYDVAKSLMEKALKEEDNISALYCLGLIDLKNRNTAEGIAKLERVQALSPNHTPTLMALGKTYFEKRYFGKSRDFFQKVIESDPTSEEARLWLGKSYVNLNDKERAREILATVNHGQEAVEAAAILKDI